MLENLDGVPEGQTEAKRLKNIKFCLKTNWTCQLHYQHYQEGQSMKMIPSREACITHNSSLGILLFLFR